MLAPGSLVGGRYRLVRILGQGGMGEVWEAVQLPLSRRVAVKTVLTDLAQDDSMFVRFKREAETAAALGHPNIVQVTDFVPGDPPLLVMELLEGETLAAILEREHKLEPARAAFIGQQILSGLAAAHGAGIVHRDMKPSNVFLLSTLAMRDIVKIVDFGLAKLVMDAAPKTVPMVTRLGQVLGTVAYMAPEQASGDLVDPRADLYAVGATLFHCICGVKPYDVIELGKPRARCVDLAPWIDPRLGDVIDRALATRPEDRWPSATAMAEAIAPFAHRTSLPPSSNTTTSPLHAPVAPGSTLGSSPSNPGSGPGAYAPTALAAPTPSWNPPSPVYPSYTPPPPMPMSSPAAPPRFPAWAIAALLALVIVPMLGLGAWVYAIDRRPTFDTGPAALARGEREFLKMVPLKPCPSPERCTVTLTDHDVTYPLCTNKAPGLNPLSFGEMIVVKRGGKPKIVMVDDPQHAHAILEVDAFSLDPDAVVGRLCVATPQSVDIPTAR